MTSFNQTFDWKLYEYPKVTVPAIVRWDSADPLTLKVSFIVQTDKGTSNVDWEFARDLLTEAIEKNSSGYGDVRVAVVQDAMLLTIESPFGTQKFVLDDYTVMGQFLARTYQEVPRGDEDCFPSLDAALAQILSESA